MLFQVTITHPAHGCPFLRDGEETVGSDLLARSQQFDVSVREAVWEAGCVLFGQGDHRAHWLVEAPSPASATAFAHSVAGDEGIQIVEPVFLLPSSAARLR